MRGRFEMWRLTPDSSENAIRNFKSALEKDPKLAEAAAELANTYRRSGLAGLRPPNEAFSDAEEAARRAIALDARLPQAYTVLADIKRDQWKWTESMDQYQDTIHRFPDYIPAHVGFAIGLTVVGRWPEAAVEAQKVLELTKLQDPVGNSSVVDVAAAYYNMRDFDKALALLDPPGNKDTYASALNAWKGIVYGGSGRPREAVEAHQLARILGEKTAGMTCYYINALARSGRRDEALRLLHEVETTSEYVPPSSLAIAYVGVGDYERAFRQLDIALDKHDPLLQYIVVEWNLDPIRQHPRFRRVVTGMGLSL
jgi:tetratricopeptide (TPR) repeat protein